MIHDCIHDIYYYNCPDCFSLSDDNNEYAARDAYDSNGNLIYKGTRTMNKEAEILKLGAERAAALGLETWTNSMPPGVEDTINYSAKHVHKLLGSADLGLIPGERSYLVIDIPKPPDTAESLLRELVEHYACSSYGQYDGALIIELALRAKKLVAALGEKK